MICKLPSGLAEFSEHTYLTIFRGEKYGTREPAAPRIAGKSSARCSGRLHTCVRLMLTLSAEI
jgi:hypothetical protein